MNIETIAATPKVGAPKWNGVGSATTGPEPTWEKSAIPSAAATAVPTTIARRIESRERNPTPTFESTTTTSSVNAASPMSAGCPKVGSSNCLLPPAQRAATGSRLSPIVVMMTPVTTGGKNRTMRAKNGATSRPSTAAPITEPKTAGSPPPEAIAPIVATLANETPCTSGSWEPKNGTPTDCRIVERPPMNRQDATRIAISDGGRPAAPPMMSGTAMMPPYIVSTCWSPNAR